MTHAFTARRGATLLGSLAAGLLLAGALAPSALAHNTLIASSPEDGAELDAAPDEVTLTFNTSVGEGGNAIVVTGPDGSTYEDGEVAVDGPDASVALKAPEEAGEYTIAYRIISADGHPLEEQLTFTLSEEAVPEETAAAEEPPAPTDAAGGDDAGADASPAARTGVADDPMSALGPVGGVVAAIAAIAVVAILVVRMRNRPGSGGDGGNGNSGA
ncbi:copper resistance protein CopC [Nocardiopsis mangrovi]|uniref:Copper resistance protein CopC n=1 Tax=Nocardiopsis mangrovi TaxID=1179818 RepID=A0ABV9DWA7_9ACTN